MGVRQLDRDHESGLNVAGETALAPEMLARVTRYAVYRCYGTDGALLYIGSGNLGQRLASHAEKVWFLEVRGITVEWYADELDARNAERRAIHVEHPKYNVQHRNASNPTPRKRTTGRTDLTTLPREEKIRRAQQVYRLSLQAGAKRISQRDLGEMFGHSKQWGADRQHEVDEAPGGIGRSAEWRINQKQRQQARCD